jgi:hypothetical protein
LGEIIDLCQLVDDYLKMATQVMQNVDDVCSGNFNSIDVDQLQSFLH